MLHFSKPYYSTLITFEEAAVLCKEYTFNTNGNQMVGVLQP